MNGAAAAAAERATALRTLIDKVLAGKLCVKCAAVISTFGRHV